MPTALQIIDRSYSMIGLKAAGEPLSADDANYALTAMNSMIDSWNTQRLMIVSIQEVVASISAISATIGPSATFNTTRPIKIEQGCYTLINNISYPMQVVDRLTYARVTSKTVAATFPAYVYYDDAVPVGTLYFWPIPTAAVEIHIPIQVQLTAFADVSTVYTLAPGYQRALEYSLAEELEPGIKNPSQKLEKQAQNARRAIKRTNAVVPLLDISVPTNRRYSYSGLYGV
jgi:hypothetical protein